MSFLISLSLLLVASTAHHCRLQLIATTCRVVCKRGLTSCCQSCTVCSRSVQPAACSLYLKSATRKILHHTLIFTLYMYSNCIMVNGNKSWPKKKKSLKKNLLLNKRDKEFSDSVSLEGIIFKY